MRKMQLILAIILVAGLFFGAQSDEVNAQSNTYNVLSFDIDGDLNTNDDRIHLTQSEDGACGIDLPSGDITLVSQHGNVSLTAFEIGPDGVVSEDETSTTIINNLTKTLVVGPLAQPMPVMVRWNTGNSESSESETWVCREAGDYYVWANTLWLRSGPGTNYERLTSIPFGTEVVLENDGCGWVSVEYAGQTGFIYVYYVDENPPVNETTCPTWTQIEALGEIVQPVFGNGGRAGAQINFSVNFTRQPWTAALHLNGESVNSIRAGEMGTIWVTTECEGL